MQRMEAYTVRACFFPCVGKVQPKETTFEVAQLQGVAFLFLLLVLSTGWKRSKPQTPRSPKLKRAPSSSGRCSHLGPCRQQGLRCALLGQKKKVELFKSRPGIIICARFHTRIEARNTSEWFSGVFETEKSRKLCLSRDSRFLHLRVYTFWLGFTDFTIAFEPWEARVLAAVFGTGVVE